MIRPPPGTTDEEIKAVEQATPLGRWGGPEAIVRAVLFLVETDFVTGETIRVQGMPAFCEQGGRLLQALAVLVGLQQTC
jgi:NAD(P)-dependent dehydrogenase (short-subunit alcohol dehydrogenase family)